MTEKKFLDITVDEELEILLRGVDNLVSRDELRRKLEKCRETRRGLLVKEGFDPSAPDLHLGHTVSIRKLKQFQDLGHEVVFLIGDFTGMIGDPTGQSETRPALTREEVEANAQTYRQQIFKILDPERTRIDFNSRWHAKLTFEDVIRLASRYTVARMLERDDFSRRYREGKPISITEFLYPLAQGYDSVALGCDVELGGSDQLFNLLVGRDLMRSYGMEPQVVMTLPLLEGLDGVQKMSKSLGNHIAILDPPDEMYGKTMSISDDLIYRYFELVTEVPAGELREIKARLDDPRVNPMEVKMRLAREIVTLYHGRDAAAAAEFNFIRTFRERKAPREVQDYVITESTWIVDLLRSSGLAPSGNVARDLITSGSVKVDGEKVTDVNYHVSPGDCGPEGLLLKVGKRRFLRLRRAEV